MIENPDAGPDQEDSIAAPNRWPEFSFWKLLICGCFAVLLVAAMLLPSSNDNRSPPRTVCKNNLRQLCLAIYNFETEHGKLPPAFTVDVEGNRLHSWRTLILPFIEETALFETIDLSKPWDDPVNAKAHESSPDLFRCPSSKTPSTLTTYLAIVVPDGSFGSEAPRTFSDFTDGTSQTLMLIEVGQEHAVHWMSPYDADEKIIASIGPETKLAHVGSFQAGYADGSVHNVPIDVSPTLLRKLITAAGDDPDDRINF